jgi:hypothetical protein
VIAATVSLDLDDIWTYLKVRGDPAWRERPTHFPIVIPALLDALASVGASATIFVVGADAARPDRAPWLRSLAEAGHEIGNHSHEHLSWQRALPTEEIVADLRESHAAISQLFGRAPRGYRAPGFSWNRSVLETLLAMDYRYDASVFPTWLGPIARTMFRARAAASDDHALRLGGLFGEARDVLWPLKPFCWSLHAGARLMELPVTTVPIVRTPLHHSYVAYLASFSESLAMSYIVSALHLCRLTRTSVSYLVHPTDLVGADAVPALRFFPGMGLSTTRKQQLLRRVLARLSTDRALVSLGTALETVEPSTLAVHAAHGSRDR